MKKFSVLLIVVLFFVPVFVYGLTGSALTKPIGLVRSISKFAPVAKVLSLGAKDVVKPLGVNPLLPDSPFFPAPNGIRGFITEINIEEKMIFVKDATYFSEVRQVFEKADFRIYTNEATDFYNNMVPGGIFEDLQVGDEIISKGSIDFADHTSRYSAAIYKGKFVSPEEKKMVEFVGVVAELDRANLKFTILGPTESVILLNEQSRCFQLTQQDKNEVLEYLGVRTMPDWVKDGTRVRGTMIVTPEAVEFFADNIYFSKE
jgi:hypothetical protein